MMQVQVAKISLVTLMLLAVGFHLELASAKHHIVGDGSGWTFGVNYTDWTTGKEFHVNDTLGFVYPKGYHVVVEVDETGFSTCSIGPNSRVFGSGNDTVALKSAGPMWFICGVTAHCYAGQKLAITVQ